jgi:hypothetical protein
MGGKWLDNLSYFAARGDWSRSFVATDFLTRYSNTCRLPATRVDFQILADFQYLTEGARTFLHL